MALFFDLSVPYLERDGGAAAGENKSRRDARLRAVARAVELGYAGVAYDRLFRGVLSDADRCRITPFPLPSLLRAAPSIAAGASLHRSLLGSPLDAPFRQYSRITVALDSSASAASLHSGNAILRSYDIVAARPLNQAAFDHVCQHSEVDLISIDFSQKLPFRLKLPMVEAANKRGVHFEITYSQFIADVQVRRQMLSDAKLLVDWTRGKRLIISSAASTANDLRGPYDVLNLFVFLLGLSMERAKSAISTNCRSLVADAHRRKHCYKEAIRIERIPTDEQWDHKTVWSSEWNNWDPISSGDGDLPPLDDIAKFFSAPSNQSSGSIASSFKSVSDKMPFKFEMTGGYNVFSLDRSATTSLIPEKLGVSSAVQEVPSAASVEVNNHSVLDEDAQDRISMSAAPLERKNSGCKGDLILPLAALCADSKQPGSAVADDEDPRCSHGSDLVSDTAAMPMHGSALEYCKSTNAENLISEGANWKCSTAFDNIDQSDVAMEEHIDRSDVCMGEHICLIVPGMNSDAIGDPEDVTESADSIPIITDHQMPLTGIKTFSFDFLDNDANKNAPEIISDTIGAPEVFTESADSIPIITDHQMPLTDIKTFSSDSSDNDANKDLAKREEIVKGPNSGTLVPLPSTSDDLKQLEERKADLLETDSFLNKCLDKIGEQKEVMSVGADESALKKLKLGKRRRKGWPMHAAFQLPFKRLLKPMFAREKVWHSRSQMKHLQG